MSAISRWRNQICTIFYCVIKTRQSWVFCDFCWIQLKKKVTVENEFFCFENKISLKARTNPSFLIFHDHEGARDLNVPVCLRALLHENRIFCCLLLTTPFVPLLSSPDIKSQSYINLTKAKQSRHLSDPNTIIHSQRAWAQGTFVFLSIN